MEKTTIPEILRTGQVPPVLGACPGAAVALLAEAGRENGGDRFIRSANMAARLRTNHPDNPVTDALAALIERAWASDRSFFRRTAVSVARKNPRRPARERFMSAKQRMFNAYSFSAVFRRDGSTRAVSDWPEAGNAWSPQWDRYRSVETHPAVLDALKRHTPVSLRQLLFHLPARAEMDSNKLAYFETPGKLADGIRTVTSPQKYLKRMFPHLRDDEVRDLCAPYMVAGDRFGITKSTAETVAVAVHGPQSCMAGSQGFDSPVHPYIVYDYDLGWRAAYIKATPAETEAADDHENHLDELRYSARALLFEPKKVFVRSYRHDLGKYSHASEELEAWLVQQGYSKRSQWPAGTPVRRIPQGSGHVMPYVDGEAQGVYQPYASVDNVLYLAGGHGSRIGDADNTNGLLSGGCVCEDCDETYDSEEGTCVGQHSDRNVCSSCAEDYRWVRGARGESYYLHEDNDNVVYVDDNWYDRRHIERYGYEWAEYYDDYVHSDELMTCAYDDERYKEADMCYFEDENGEGVHVAERNVNDYIKDEPCRFFVYAAAYNVNHLQGYAKRAVFNAVRDGEITDLTDDDKRHFAKLCEYLDEDNPLDETGDEE